MCTNQQAGPCHFSKSTCDFVKGRVGTYHEISFTAAGLDLGGPCCQSPSLSCCVGLCNTSLQPHTQTPAGRGEEWEEGGRYGTRAKTKTVSNNNTKWPNQGARGRKHFGLSLTQPHSLYHSYELLYWPTLDLDVMVLIPFLLFPNGFILITCLPLCKQGMYDYRLLFI